MSVSVNIKQQLGDFTLDAEFAGEGGVTALFGPSGSGKTSIINAISGLTRPDAGRIQVGKHLLFDAKENVFVPPHQRRVGYVFQEPRLFPHMSVRDNLHYGRGWVKHTMPVLPAVTALGIQHLSDRMPADLSGGEAQRVALARALLSNPQIILMDEPLAALDAPRKAELLPYLRAFMAEAKIPVFYVSHAMEEVAQLADNLVVLRAGRVVRSGDLGDMLSDPQAVSDIGVREAGAMIHVTVAKRDAGDGLSELATSAGKLFLPHVTQPQGTALRVRVKASDVILSKDKPDGLSALNILGCTVVSVHEGAGPGAAIALKSGTDRLVARITSRSARALGLKQGVKCYAVIKTVSVAPADMGAGSGAAVGADKSERGL